MIETICDNQIKNLVEMMISKEVRQIFTPSPNGRAFSEAYIKEVLNDYWICRVSRETSLLARKDVLTGRGKFGITSDGKEVPQVAMAKTFQKGDFRSGYYRDFTLMFSLGLLTVEDFFAQLYADTENDPFSGGRQMNSHFATPLVDKHGEWTNHKELHNITSDTSSTGGQMARAVGLALASKKYRENPELSNTRFSSGGEEVCFVTIGDASTSEGVFWESINASGVLKIPLAISVWDDGYGISVPVQYQTTKGSISEVLEGFRLNENGDGIDIYNIKGWDYPALCDLYKNAIERVRTLHLPALIHVQELTQPQGHSTSGSHERYKSVERLAWEKEYDCILKMREWILSSHVSTEEILLEIEQKAKDFVRERRNIAWKQYRKPIMQKKAALEAIYNDLIHQLPGLAAELQQHREELNALIDPELFEIVKNARYLSYFLRNANAPAQADLKTWIKTCLDKWKINYSIHLYSETSYSALKVPVVAPIYSEDSPIKNGFEVLNAYFDKALGSRNNVYIFGEDVGKIGGVNQALQGLQLKYGESRIFDTGIREWTIMGQAIGMSMRGLRAIAEIQYLDYLVFGLVPLCDDLSCLRYRSNGQQRSPAIIRTRGHRLEGIWHSGSPMGMIINSLRGIYVLTPRNMVQAAGMYNTMLESDDPAIVVECLNGFRLKERLPDNIGIYTVPIGVPEILSEGNDLTLVTYGSCVRIAQEAVLQAKKYGISVELIDAQTLVPFDIHHTIVNSLQKTNRIICLDEDVPGGATAYMMQQILEIQNGYAYLDSKPMTITAKEHRPAYGSDGDYFCKPNVEDVFDAIFEMMNEAEPQRFM